MAEHTYFSGGLDLKHLYHESKKLILVKFIAPDCYPCTVLNPILQKVTAEFLGKICVVEIDISIDPEIAKAASVIGTPTIQFYKNKAFLGEIQGIKQKSEIRGAIAQFLER